ncbi:hypothetical protein FZC78_21530 [Rossellomorea vietnamensis]|uniref:Polymerase nucleotidyl transferase domain-containing protein n=1 Tax=Rossellomorea vietnamensis TaxID=218284 RepID=A0A5D4NGW3_9BACI|nr:nucleotidyltransferase domain-containing protein [Rossellomorea vietnamensis]TYS13543.1 hypothetical protein FZC78_21530 [Rossellomorea vietnamensis]
MKSGVYGHTITYFYSRGAPKVYQSLEHEAADKLEGLYLHGSIVLDAYVKDCSDIDFAAVTRNRLAEAEIHTLKKIHEEIAG